jgi:hypothetical protein
MCGGCPPYAAVACADIAAISRDWRCLRLSGVGCGIAHQSFAEKRLCVITAVFARKTENRTLSYSVKDYQVVLGERPK